jgi:hypothetical protein
LGGFQSSEVRGGKKEKKEKEKRKSHQISTFGFQCIAKNIEKDD